MITFNEFMKLMEQEGEGVKPLDLGSSKKLNTALSKTLKNTVSSLNAVRDDANKSNKFVARTIAKVGGDPEIKVTNVQDKLGMKIK